MRRLILAVLLLLFCRSGWSESEDSPARQNESIGNLPRIALIIDDLGDALQAGKRTTALYGPVVCAVLPHTPYGRIIAQRAHSAGKEVILHLPLQPVEQPLTIGAGTISIDDTEAQLVRIFESDIDSVPHVVGVSSHMGSLLTRHPGHMQWLMDAVKAKGDLYFVDSYTTDASIALQLAREHGVPSVRRDVFLDTERTRAAIHREFKRLMKTARENGHAVGIGHPHPETLEYLESVLPGLMNKGFKLVAVSSLVDP